MKIADLIAHIDSIAPLQYAEPWDNVGLLMGNPAQHVTRALLTIDFTNRVAQEAIDAGCELVIAYHPPIFNALKRIDYTSPVAMAMRHNIAIYSIHTAWDATKGGVNDALGDILDLQERRPLSPAVTKDSHYKLITFVPEANLEEVSSALFQAGAGRIGDYSSCSFRLHGSGTFFGEQSTNPTVGSAGILEVVNEIRLETVVPVGAVSAVVDALRRHHPYEEPAFDLTRLAVAPGGNGLGRIGTVHSTREQLVDAIKKRLSLEHVLIAGPTSGKAQKAAVCAGAAGELVQEAIKQGADFILTGELRHHDALLASEKGVTVACTLHSNSERFSLSLLADRLRTRAIGIDYMVSKQDRDPFIVG